MSDVVDEKPRGRLVAAVGSWGAALKGAPEAQLTKEAAAQERETSRDAQREHRTLEEAQRATRKAEDARQREEARDAQRQAKAARTHQRDEEKRQKQEARIAKLEERKRLAGAAARAALGWTASVWLEAFLWVCLGLSLLVAYSVSYSSLGIVFGAFGYGSWERWAAPLAIDLPLTASVVGQLLAARWGSPRHVKAILLLLSLATAPLTLAGNALHGAVNRGGEFTYAQNGALTGGHVDLMHLVAFSIPGACVILVSLVASIMLTEREKLGRRTLAVTAESTEAAPDAQGERHDQEPVTVAPPSADAGETPAEPVATDGTHQAGDAQRPRVLELNQGDHTATSRRSRGKRGDRQQDARKARMTTLIEDGKRTGQKVTTSGLARTLRVSESTIRRWRDPRPRPRVVAREARS